MKNVHVNLAKTVKSFLKKETRPLITFFENVIEIRAFLFKNYYHCKLVMGANANPLDARKIIVNALKESRRAVNFVPVLKFL